MNEPDFWIRTTREGLVKSMNCDNWQVRVQVAQVIDALYLPRMIGDEDWRVRQHVAYRIDKKYLPRMMNDKNVCVRKQVAIRIDEFYLPMMMNDPERNVRLEVVCRLNREDALLMSGVDDDEFVRKIALKIALDL